MRSVLIASLSLLWFFAPLAHAEVLVDEASQLVIQAPEELSISDYTNQFRLAQGQNIQVERVYRIGQQGSAPFADVILSTMPAIDLMEQAQLRLINPLSRQNGELLSTSSVEVRGTGFEDQQERSLYLVPGSTFHIVVVAYQPSSPQLQLFLQNLSFSSGIADIQGHRFQKDIDGVINASLFSGSRTTDGQMAFQPELEITRAALIKVVVLMNSSEDQVLNDYEEYLLRDEAPLFTDLDPDAWFAPYIYAASQAGIVKGYEDQTIRPASLVNLAEALKLIAQAVDPTLQPAAEPWYQAYLGLFTRHSILIGNDQEFRLAFDQERFQLYENAKRYQVAALIHRLVSSDSGGLYGQELSFEQLPIQFLGLNVDKALEIDSATSGISPLRHFVLESDEGMFELLAYSPDVYTQLERQQAFPESFHYLTETRSQVFAVRGRENQPEFRLLDNQDLLSFRDENLKLQFLHAVELSPDVQRSGNEAFLKLKRSDDLELLSLNLLPRGSGQASAFQERSPLRSLRLGNLQCYVYLEADKNRLDLVTEGQNWLAVVSLPSVQDVVQLDAKVLRILRTMSGL